MRHLRLLLLLPLLLLAAACSDAPTAAPAADLDASPGEDAPLGDTSPGEDAALEGDAAPDAPECQGEGCLYTPDLDTTWELVTVDLSDPDRPGGERPIPIALYIPNDAPRPLPIIILSHGGATGKTDPTRGMDKWAPHFARAGYLAVAIAHVGRDDASRRALCQHLDLDSDACAELKYLNWDRPHDVGVVLDWLEAQAAGPRAGDLDLSRVGHIGHSAGAGCALMLAGATRVFNAEPVSLAEPRLRAFLAFSPQGPGSEGFTESSYDAVTAPVLIGTGTGDANEEDTPESRSRPFHLMPPGDHYLAFIDDPTAKHVTFELEEDGCLRVGGTRCDEFTTWMASTGLAFADAYLRDAPRARAWLATDHLASASGGVATLSVR